MPFSRSLNVVGCHAEGEVGDVVNGGVLDVPDASMHDKMIHFWRHNDSIRQLLLNEPRGRAAKCANIILPPCDPRADAGFLIMESDEWVAMSGSNTMCVTTVLLETGMLLMQEPMTQLNLDIAAGLVEVTAECENGKCKNVEFENVPSFVFELDYQVDVTGLGTIKVDIVYGGMIFAMVDAAAIGQILDEDGRQAAQLVELGERIKTAPRAQIVPVHPGTQPSVGSRILSSRVQLPRMEKLKKPDVLLSLCREGLIVTPVALEFVLDWPFSMPKDS